MCKWLKTKQKKVVEEPVIKETKLSPFDIVKNINTKKEHFTEEQLKQAYIPFVINKAFSQSDHTIFFADEMNINSGISKDLLIRMQYDFYYNIIPKNNRYSKWQKKDTSDDEIINMIQQLFKYSYKHAVEILPLVKDKKGYLKSLLDKGGIIK